MKSITIIIPALNEEETLPLCLASVNALDYPQGRVDVIVVDNGSTDRTREIARDFGALVLCDDALSVSGLRNLGAKNAKGEILAFLDADCIVDPGWLREAERYFESPETAAWGSPPAVPKNATWVQNTWYLVRKKKEQVSEAEWLESMNLFVRKDDFTAIGGFNESLVTCEDVDFSYRIKTRGRIVADTAISVIHLGEADTIKSFFKKELWRGQSNLAGLFRHKFQIKELPSLLIPLYFGIFLPITIMFSVFSQGWGFIFIPVTTVLLPSVVLILRIVKKGKLSGGEVCRLFYLSQLYFAARTMAVVKRRRQ